MTEMDPKLLFNLLIPLFAKQKDYFHVIDGGESAAIFMNQIVFTYKIYNRFQKANIKNCLSQSFNYSLSHSLLKEDGYERLYIHFDIPKTLKFAITQIVSNHADKLSTTIKNKITSFCYNSNVNNMLLGLTK